MEPLFTARDWAYLEDYFALTSRQAELVRLIFDNHTYESAAAAMGISLNTVRMHMRALYLRLGVHDRVGLILQLALARQHWQNGTASPWQPPPAMTTPPPPPPAPPGAPAS